MSENKAQYQAGEQQQLKPCPFCGGQQLEMLDAPCVFCEICGADGPIGETKDEAIRYWNNSGSEIERLRAQLDAAKAALEQLADGSNYIESYEDIGWDGEQDTPWDFAADALKELE